MAREFVDHRTVMFATMGPKEFQQEILEAANSAVAKAWYQLGVRDTLANMEAHDTQTKTLSDELESSRQTISKLRVELAALEDMLPKSRDGKPLRIGDKVANDGSTIRPWTITKLVAHGDRGNGEIWIMPEELGDKIEPKP